MRKSTLTPCLLLLLIILSIRPLAAQKSEKRSLDARLVGTWVGSEKDGQVEGLEKEWSMERKANGKFTLNFMSTYMGQKQTSIESGMCWTEGNLFYEYHESSGKTDVYEYEVLNENQVRFTMKSHETYMEDNEYTFVDTREGTMGASEAAGTTFANAIKVKSIKEEYKYVERVCAGCTLDSQALEIINYKPYDKLTMTKPDGSQVTYYFDISAFYGKY